MNADKQDLLDKKLPLNVFETIFDFQNADFCDFFPCLKAKVLESAFILFICGKFFILEQFPRKDVR